MANVVFKFDFTFEYNHMMLSVIYTLLSWFFFYIYILHKANREMHNVIIDSTFPKG